MGAACGYCASAGDASGCWSGEVGAGSAGGSPGGCGCGFCGWCGSATPTSVVPVASVAPVSGGGGSGGCGGCGGGGGSSLGGCGGPGPAGGSGARREWKACAVGGACVAAEERASFSRRPEPSDAKTTGWYASSSLASAEFSKCLMSATYDWMRAYVISHTLFELKRSHCRKLNSS